MIDPAKVDPAKVDPAKIDSTKIDPAKLGVEEQFIHLQEQVRHQEQRIHALEQALDQSLASLDELRSQGVNQQFLEQQLASTEAFANVQQQAIHQLKLQFAQEKAELEERIAQLNERDSRDLVGPRQLDLLAGPLDAADPPKAVESRLPQEPPAEALEMQSFVDRTTQQMTQAFFQQAFQELESDRQQSQHRIAELERQAAEMQEQILSQAQQASEYETAVQHWKNRFYILQDQLLMLKQLLEDNPVILSNEVQELLAALSSAPVPEPKAFPRVDPFQQAQKIDVPEFLARRRTYRRNSNPN